MGDANSEPSGNLMGFLPGWQSAAALGNWGFKVLSHFQYWNSENKMLKYITSADFCSVWTGQGERLI